MHSRVRIVMFWYKLNIINRMIVSKDKFSEGCHQVDNNLFLRKEFYSMLLFIQHGILA